MRAMTPFESRPSLGLLVLAFACLPAVALSQTLVGQAGQPIVITAKKATHLLLHRTVPEYPPLAKVNYIQGRVRLELEVAADGKVAHAHVLKGNAILAASALQTLRNWTYRPLLTTSGPSAFLTTVELNYTLRGQFGELGPEQAERDLRRQVKPPEVLRRPVEASLRTLMRIRLLLNDQGQVIDSDPSLEAVSDFTPAQKILQGWTFRPARWGSLPIPWYLDVDVPVSEARLPPPAGVPEHR